MPANKKPKVIVRQIHKRFAAAKSSSELGGRLDSLSLGVDATLKRDVVAIRRLSRKAGEDNSYVVKYLGMVENGIVGPEGFKFQSKVKNADGVLDKELNKLIEAEFKTWAKKGNCDVTGQYSWCDIQTLFARTTAQDGSVLVRMVEGFPNEWGFAVELIESDHIDLNYDVEHYNGNKIISGVEINEWGRHVAYHVLTSHPGEKSYYRGNTQYKRIPAEEMLYAWYPFRIGQKTGVPWSHAALLEFLDLYNYRESVLTSARLGASKTFAYEANEESIEPDDDDDEPIFEYELNPAEGVVVPQGYTIKTLDFKSDGGNASDINKLTLQGGASGLEVNYNSLANDLEGVNFSSIRHGVLEDRDGWMKKQRWMRETLCDRVISHWLKMALVTQRIPLSITQLPRLQDYFFQARRWPWVNPLQDAKANTEAINNRTTSPQKVIREQGDDPDDIIADFVEWAEKTKKLPSNNNAKSNQKPEEDKNYDE